MDFFVVFMDCLRHVAVKKEWLSNPEYVLNEKQQGNYDVFVLKSFGMTLI